MIEAFINKIIKKQNLSENEIIQAMDIITKGEATPCQIAGFITALRMKGESIEEITGCAKLMREKAEKIYPQLDYFIDTCGTGGDGANTFNISTIVALIVASSGVAVAKHGNRSVSSKSGSADILEALGVNIDLTPEEVKECIETIGVGFMFAPNFHKSMKFAANPRKELGIRTIFNILGPLINPALAKGQILGVFDKELVKPIASVLKNLNLERAMVIHGEDGLDEITLTDKTFVCELKDGELKEYYINPEDLGLKLCSPEDIKGGDSLKNKEIILDILNNKKDATFDITILNSAAALYVGKKVNSLEEGIKLSKELIESGKALEKLNQLVTLSHELKKRRCNEKVV